MAQSDYRFESSGPYELVSDRTNGKCWGALWFRQAKKEKIKTVEAASTDQCMEMLRGFLYGLREAEIAKNETTLPSPEQVLKGLEHALSKATHLQKLMLAAHLRAPEQVISFSELAAAAGYDDFHVANSQYGNLGWLIYGELPSRLPIRKTDNQPMWSCAIGFEEDATDPTIHNDGQYRMRMRPHIVAALTSTTLLGTP